MIATFALILAQVSNPAANASPEHLLRFTYQKGATQRFRISSTHSAGSTTPSTITLQLHRRVLEVAKGRARIEIALEKLSFGETDPRNAVFAKLIGAAWRGWVDDRGRFEAMTLVPPKDLPVLLHPMIKYLQRLLPGQAIPLPEQSLRVGDDWQIPAKDLAAAPDGSWAKTAKGGLICTLLSADPRRATIAIKLRSPSGKNRLLTGQGKMIFDLRAGALEAFELKSHLHMQTTIAGGTSSREIKQDYRLSSQPGDNP
jgi:hypothetical protein